jgi:N-acetylneuraminic acid mutarotase
LTTDDQGVVQCDPKTYGVLSVRAKMVEETSGERNGEKYESVRTYSTLTLPVTRPTVESLSHHLPALPKGITSFGAAVLGNDLYVYGGHFGEAHHYSESGQSNEFLRISMTAENADWEKLASGPKLTGLALVEHGGRLYRTGGFTAKNSDDEDQNLWSQNSFAMFDPAKGMWTELTALPEGRSSHDAAVLDGKLYVVGGWNMAGPDITTWHKTALVCDLTQPELKWTELPSPGFERRAISVAGCKGKLYVIGGMESSGETTRKVSVFDPVSQEWTSGPDLSGTGMEGFGTSAFAAGNQLIVTSMSGALQMLSDDGTSWIVAGQAREPRFFHRQLTTTDGRVLLLGGASMASGKSETLELLQFLAR